MQFRKLTLLSIAHAVLAAYVATAPARADEVKAGDLVISQAWSRATPKGAKTGGGYLTIENKGSAPDRLIGGSTDVAGSVEVHEMSTEGGVCVRLRRGSQSSPASRSSSRRAATI